MLKFSVCDYAPLSSMRKIKVDMIDNKHYKTSIFSMQSQPIKMKLILLVFLAYLGSSVVRSNASGYYFWRDYYGEIPDDAFPAGSDINGDLTYIGQALHEKCLVPSKIYGSTKKVYFEYGAAEHEGTNQVKILCTTNPEKLEWIATDNEKIKSLTDVYLIIGGYEPIWTTYIGRVRSNGEVVAGKAIADNFVGNAGYWGTTNGRSLHLTEFDVLSLKKDAPPLCEVKSNI